MCNKGRLKPLYKPEYVFQELDLDQKLPEEEKWKVSSRLLPSDHFFLQQALGEEYMKLFNLVGIWKM